MQITDKKAVVCALDDPTPIAYINVYEEGDIWIKTQGCEACPAENRKKCCNNCGMFSELRGCVWHLEKQLATSSKPWSCVVKPYPDAAMSFCSLEYKCVVGSHRGKIRRVKDPGDIFGTG